LSSSRSGYEEGKSSFDFEDPLPMLVQGLSSGKRIEIGSSNKELISKETLDIKLNLRVSSKVDKKDFSGC